MRAETRSGLIAVGIVVGIVLTVTVAVIVSNSGAGPADQPAGNASGLTRQQFRDKLWEAAHSKYTDKIYNASPGNPSAWIYTDKLFAAVGKPSKEEVVGKQVFWYWKCRDGLIQVAHAQWYYEDKARKEIQFESANDVSQ